MEEVKISWMCGSDPQSRICAGGETCWKAAELGRYRREVDSINNLHACEIQVLILCSEFI